MNVHALFNLYWISQTLIAAVRLGIFDQLAKGAQTPAQVAQALGLHPDATARLLRALCRLGLIQQRGLTYTNAPLAAASLVSSSPQYVGAIAHQHAEQLMPLWQHLDTAVREGRPVLREAFGGDQNPYDVLTATPEALGKLMAGMHAGAKGLGEGLLLAHDFARHQHVLDVGGGTGVVTAPLAQRHPHLRVTILDLPQVCAAVGPVLRAYGCGDRIRCHGGDFFRPETFPVGCDAAVICRVLHNWSDQKALAILRGVRAAMAPGGVVLVQEYMLDPPDPSGGTFAFLSDLLMLAMTDGGRERTAPEYEALLKRAGFRPLGTVRLPGALAVVKGLKA